MKIFYWWSKTLKNYGNGLIIVSAPTAVQARETVQNEIQNILALADDMDKLKAEGHLAMDALVGTLSFVIGGRLFCYDEEERQELVDYLNNILKEIEAEPIEHLSNVFYRQGND